MQEDDRDNLAMKRLDLAGPLLGGLFRQLFKKLRMELKKQLKSALDRGREFSVKAAVMKSAIITNGLNYWYVAVAPSCIPLLVDRVCIGLAFVLIAGVRFRHFGYGYRISLFAASHFTCFLRVGLFCCPLTRAQSVDGQLDERARPAGHAHGRVAGAEPADVCVDAVAFAARELAHRARGQGGQAAHAAQHALGDGVPVGDAGGAGVRPGQESGPHELHQRGHR